MKILNLYCGIGGNRKLWGNDHDITAVEYNEDIAHIYSKSYPKDKIIIDDAHQYLLNHYNEFDFIWSSPPCQTHSKMNKATRHKLDRYPKMELYQEIIFLGNFFKGIWVVENVIPYYQPLIQPKIAIDRHLFWSNFFITKYSISKPKNFIQKDADKGREELMNWLGIYLDKNIYVDKNHSSAQVLRNCIHPKIGLHILNCAKGKYNQNKVNYPSLFEKP